MAHQLRRPRFERAAVAGMALTPRDLEILRAVQRHRLLRSTHLIALLDGCRQTTLRRLQLLFHHGYLDRPAAQLDWYAQGSEPMVYALGNRGAAALVAEGERGRTLRWDKNRQRLPPVPPPHPRGRRGHGRLRGGLPEPGGGGVHSAGGDPCRSAGSDPTPAPALPLAGRSSRGRQAPWPRSGTGSGLWPQLRRRAGAPPTRILLPRSRPRHDAGYQEGPWANLFPAEAPWLPGDLAAGPSPDAPWHPELPGPHGHDERGADAAPRCRVPFARGRPATLPLRGPRGTPPRGHLRLPLGQRVRGRPQGGGMPVCAPTGAWV